MTTEVIIDGYRITGLLGQGGMAKVYVATERELEREVAIKVVEVGGDGEQVTRLEFEAKSLARLQHPNIVELYRFGRLSNHSVYYVMPLLTGGDLSHWIKPVAEVKVHALLVSLLDALDHAHQAGIVHRDIKPENILFDRQNRPMLADFGAALQLEQSRITQEGFAIGSVGYMSPEQARGLAIGPSSDLYSLAVLAFELLANKPSFVGHDSLSLALAQMEQPIGRMPPDLMHWQPFFQVALQPNPQDRYSTASEMRAALPNPKSLPKTLVVPALKLTSRPAKTKRWLLAGTLICAALFLGWSFYKSAQTLKLYEQASFAVNSAALLPKTAEASAFDVYQQEKAGLSATQADSLACSVFSRTATELKALVGASEFTQLVPLWMQLNRIRKDCAVIPAEFTKLEASLSLRVLETLKLSAELFDKETARATLPLAQLLNPSADLTVRMAAAQAIPVSGETFTSENGLAMRLLRAPQGADAGLAIMAEPLSVADFQRFSIEKKLNLTECATGAVRGCMNQANAARVVQWLNAQSGPEFAIPNRAVWAAVRESAPKLGSALAVSTECFVETRSKQPGAVARGWGNIKGVFGGKRAATIVTRRCNGELGFLLDGSGKTAKNTGGRRSVLVLVAQLNSVK